jgi:fused signal recognition particle receptor
VGRAGAAQAAEDARILTIREKEDARVAAERKAAEDRAEQARLQSELDRRQAESARAQALSAEESRKQAELNAMQEREAAAERFRASPNEAIEIAKQCPGLEYGAVVEVRPVADICSIKQRAEEYSTQELAGATA